MAGDRPKVREVVGTNCAYARKTTTTKWQFSIFTSLTGMDHVLITLNGTERNKQQCLEMR